MTIFYNIIAQISFYDSESGGRNVPFGQGFSPKLVFDSSSKEYFTELEIDKTQTIFPGDKLKLQLKIKGEPGIYLHKGASFDLHEGDKKIGNGTVMKLV